MKHSHIGWKSSKCRIWIFCFLAFSTNFCLIKNDLSDNTAWPQTSSFLKCDFFCNFQTLCIWEMPPPLVMVFPKQSQEKDHTPIFLCGFFYWTWFESRAQSQAAAELPVKTFSLVSLRKCLETVQKTAPRDDMRPRVFQPVHQMSSGSHCLKITQNVALNIASEASYV